MLIGTVEGHGFNPEKFDTAIPRTAAHVAMSTNRRGTHGGVAQTGEAFSASRQWNFCDSGIGNAGATIRAQKNQLEWNETVRTEAANKKSKAQLRALEKALSRLAKFELNSHLMNEMDSGDVIRWVLPETQVEFLLKDLKKKQQILAKLATLPQDWTTYIVPLRQALAAVSITTV
jgi:hypothetical protein